MLLAPAPWLKPGGTRTAPPVSGFRHLNNFLHYLEYSGRFEYRWTHKDSCRKGRKTRVFPAFIHVSGPFDRGMIRSSGLKVGDFVKHKKNARIIFQIVQVLDAVNESQPGMLNCIQVRDILSYPEEEVVKYDLAASSPWTQSPRALRPAEHIPRATAPRQDSPGRSAAGNRSELGIDCRQSNSELITLLGQERTSERRFSIIRSRAERLKRDRLAGCSINAERP